MALNKFEKHIQKQLEEREIQPSSDTWLKLNDRLDETVIEQPKKRSYFWYAVAACLVGLIIFSAVFFKATTAITESNIQVVEDAKKAIDAVENLQKSEDQRNAVVVVSTEIVPEEKAEDQVAKVNIEVAEKEAYDEQLVAAPNGIQVSLHGSSKEIINTKVLQVLAQVDDLEQDKAVLTDAEVDSLLRKAQEEILRAKLFRSDHSVDAMALLSEVENELDKSFRDQIFESLKSGFLKARTAFADRNN